jgi:hypothetical protein
MRSNNYIEKINLGEEDGAKNVLIKTSREVAELTPGQKPWATMRDTSKIIGISLPTLYEWVYQEYIPCRRFKKQSSDRAGITLLPVKDALEFARSRRQARPSGYAHHWVRDAVKNIKEVPDDEIQRFISKLHGIINRQAAQIGKWPTQEIARAFRALAQAKEDKETGNHEPAKAY